MEHILTKEKMDAMKALADTNIKISEARDSLAKIKALESSYLSDREKKAIEVVEKVIQDSENLLKEAKGNYVEVMSLYNTVSEFSSFLADSYKQFNEMLVEFEKKNMLWTSSLKAKEDELSQITETVRLDKIRIKNDRESLNRKEEDLRSDRRKISDDRAMIERTIIRLKEGKI